jgi:Holliday junction resolvase
MVMGTKDKAYILFEAAQAAGWSNAREIADFARRLDRGLPAEDELSVIFHWLGRCKLVHKLDQFPYPPGIWSHYRVPDLLAVFEVDGFSVPVLIEVKNSADSILSWKPDYLDALQSYAALLKMPLLVAWKHRTFWTLFEARHLRKAKKNLKISFSEAMSETLLGLLAGDFSFSFRQGAGIHIKIRKLKETADGGFDGKIEESYLQNPEGERHTGEGGILQLFTCVAQEPHLHEDGTHAVQSFVVPNERHAEFAHRSLVTLLRTYGGEDHLVWRQVMLKEQLPLLLMSPQQAVKNGLEAGFIKHKINIRPKTRPTFIRA